LGITQPALVAMPMRSRIFKISKIRVTLTLISLEEGREDCSCGPCFETRAARAPQHEVIFYLNKTDLVLRRPAQRTVSKDKPQHLFMT
jgi:hypothetical protein